MKQKMAWLFLILVFSIGNCWAQDCNKNVVDNAGAFGSDISRVEASVQDLVNLGAEVRVRTYRILEGHQDINSFEEALEKSCPSWRAADGGTRNNLIVLICAVDDHESGIYAGSEWESILGGGKWNEIRSDIMNPRFRDGDFAGGFINSMKEISNLIKAKRRASSSGGAPVVVQEPADYSGLWSFLKWFLAVAGLGAAIFFLFSVMRRRKEENEKRAAAQQEALSAKSGCASISLGFSEEVQLTEIRVKDLASKVSPSSAKELLSVWGDINGEISSAKSAFSLLGERAVNDPSSLGLAANVYRQMASSYKEVMEKLRKAEKALTDFKERLGVLDDQIKTAPNHISLASDMITSSRESVENVASQGFKTEEANALLVKADEACASARKMLEEKRFSEVISMCDHASTFADNAKANALALSARKESLADMLGKAKGRFSSVRAQIEAGSKTFAEISSQYAESSWHSIVGNGTEADNRLEWSFSALEEIGKAVSMEVQDWNKAEEMLHDVNAWLDEAESFMRSISALKDNLESSRRDAPGEIQEAAADIEKARGFISEHDPDVREELEDNLAHAGEVLKEAEAELSKAMPDFILVVKLAKQANSSADKILIEARSEHEAAERLRNKAVTSLREAKRSISAAKEYIEDHQSDVDSSASTLLSNAKADFAKAEGSSDLNIVVKYADSADDKADRALSQAESDVSEAQSRRRKASQSHSSWGSVSSSPSYGHRSSGSFSSRSSSHTGGGGSWGGSSRIGGGGSFGGSSRVGGGGKW